MEARNEDSGWAVQGCLLRLELALGASDLVINEVGFDDGPQQQEDEQLAEGGTR